MFLKLRKKIFTKNLAPFIAVFLIYLPTLFIFYKFAELNPSGYSFPILLGDSSEYVTLAHNLLEHRSFSLASQPPYHPDYFRTPGYPLFLALILSIFPSYYAVSLFQIILAAATALLIIKIGERLISPTAGLIAAFLYVINSSTLYYSMVLMSDILFSFLIVLAVYLIFFFNSKRDILLMSAAGFLIGLATLVRPIALFLPFLLLTPYFFFNRRTVGFKRLIFLAFIFVIAWSIVLTPWILRNKLQSGVWAISSIGSFNLFHYNLPLFLSFKYNESMGAMTTKLYAETSGLNEEGAKRLEHSKELTKIIWKYISPDPFGYARFHLSRLPQFFLGNSSKNFYVDAIAILEHRPNPFPEKTLLIDDLLRKRDLKLVWKRLTSQSFFPLEYFVWLMVAILSLASVFFRKYRFFALFFISLTFYFAILTGPVVHVRYRLPVEPFMFLSAVLGFYGLKEWLKNLWTN